jgi:hypothetical protein
MHSTSNIGMRHDSVNVTTRLIYQVSSYEPQHVVRRGPSLQTLPLPFRRPLSPSPTHGITNIQKRIRGILEEEYLTPCIGLLRVTT